MIVKKSDDAVSPVIGVMLMVVIVVIIAAVVTAFATGMMSETEAAPVAALDVEILNSAATLSDLNGPELFITHRSGDAVDTKDIELQFSWVCGVADCTYGGVHSSTYSADGFKEAHPNGISSNLNNRMQALYVKTTMAPERTEYNSYTAGGLTNYYFGDVILTPGLKLTAQSELLSGFENTQSQFMDAVFNNYQIRTESENTDVYNIILAEEHVGEVGMYNPECPACVRESEFWGEDDKCYCGYGNPPQLNGKDICAICSHYAELCTGDGNPNVCDCYGSVMASIPKPTIMTHLPAGTAVDVMIIHTPSGKAIYDKTVIVQ